VRADKKKVIKAIEQFYERQLDLDLGDGVSRTVRVRLK